MKEFEQNLRDMSDCVTKASTSASGGLYEYGMQAIYMHACMHVCVGVRVRMCVCVCVCVCFGMHACV